MIVLQAVVSAILTSLGSGLIKYGLNRLEMPAGASGFLSVPVLMDARDGRGVGRVHAAGATPLPSPPPPAW